MKRAIATGVLILLAFAVSCKRPEEKGPVELVTTPEVLATGVVQYLAGVFTRQSNVQVRIRAVPLAQLMASADVADVVVTGDAATPQALDRAGKVRLHNRFAFDDYAITGPSRDPAHVRRAASAPEAFRAIAARRRTFCAPVDVPALRKRELEIWSAAAIDPQKEKRVRDCRGDAAAVLAEAGRRGAYTLSYRAVAEGQHARTLLSGTPMLRDPFTILLIRRPKPNKDAEWLVEWVMSFRGRDAVQSFAAPDGRRLYVGEP